MRAIGEGTLGTHEDDVEDTQLDDHARVPRGFSKIMVEGRRQRAEALR